MKQFERKIWFLWKAIKYLLFNKEPYTILMQTKAITDLSLVKAYDAKGMIKMIKQKILFELIEHAMINKCVKFSERKHPVADVHFYTAEIRLLKPGAIS